MHGQNRTCCFRLEVVVLYFNWYWKLNCTIAIVVAYKIKKLHIDTALCKETNLRMKYVNNDDNIHKYEAKQIKLSGNRTNIE